VKRFPLREIALGVAALGMLSLSHAAELTADGVRTILPTQPS